MSTTAGWDPIPEKSSAAPAGPRGEFRDRRTARPSGRSRSGRSRDSARPRTPERSAGTLPVARSIEWALIGACLALPTLFLGGLHPLGKLIYLALVAALAVYQAFAFPNRASARTGAAAFWIGGIAIVAIQLLPLPAAMLGAIAGGYEELLPAWNSEAGFGSWTTISLAPRAGGLGLAVLVAHALFFRCAASALQERADLDRALTLAAWLGLFVAGLALAQYFLGNGRYLWIYDYPTRDAQDTAKIPFTNGNHLAHYLALCAGPWIWLLVLAASGRKLPSFGTLPAILRRRSGRSFGDHGLRPEAVVLAGLACVVGVAAVLLTFSRGGALVFGIACVVAVAWYARRGVLSWKLAAGAGGLFAAAGFAAFLYGGDRLARELDADQLSTWERLDPGFLRTRLWLADVEAWKRFPLLGSGVGSHREIYPTFYAYWYPKEYRFAESGYVQLLVETGAVGLLLAFAAIGLVAWKLWRSHPTSSVRTVGRRSTKREHAQGELIWGAVAAAFAASVLHNVFDFGWYLPGCFSLTLLLGAAIFRAAAMRAEADSGAHAIASASSSFSRFAIPSFAQNGLVAALSAGVLLWLGVTALLPEVRGAAAWDDYMRIAVRFEGRGMFDGSPDAASDDDVSAMMAALQSRLRETPDDARASVRLAGLCLRRFEQEQLAGDNAFTLADLRQTLDEGGFRDDAARRAWLDKIVGPRGKLLDAAAVYANRALCRSPLDGEACVYLAAVGPLVGDESPSPDLCYRQALACRPYDAATLLQAADFAARSGDEAAAIERLRMAYEIVPPARARIVVTLGPTVPPSFFLDDLDADVDGCRQLAEYYLRERRFAEATLAADRWFDRLATDEVDVVENPLRSWTALADVNDALQRTERTVDCLERAVAIAPEEYVLRRRRAFALVALDRLDDADAELVQCLRMRPEDPHVKRQRRLVIERQDETRRAAEVSDAPTIYR